MLECTVILKHLSTKDSFIYLSNNLSFLNNETCIKLTYNDTVGYFSISGKSANLDDNSIGLNSLYAKTLGIHDGQSVLLKEISQLPTINSITISPTNKNDYDVLEMLAENVQGTLLNQLRVVYISQSFVVWIGNNINVTVVVDDVSPVSPGMLGFLTEVHIKEKMERKVAIPAIINEQKRKFDMEKLKPLFTLFHKQIAYGNLKKKSNFKEDLVYRVVPLSILPLSEQLGNQKKIFNVFTSNKDLPSQWIKEHSLTSLILCTITLLIDNIFYDKKLYVRIITFEDIFPNTESDLSNNLFISEDVFNYFQCELGSRVVLKYVESVPSVNEIEIHTKQNYLINIEEHFKKFLADNSDDILVLNSDVAFDTGNHIICSLKFSPVESQFIVVDDKLVRNCKYSVHSETITMESSEKKIRGDDVNFLEDIANYSLIINEILYNFNTLTDTFENIMLIGNPGTGKSSLLKLMESRLRSYPNFVYTHTIHCKHLKGKTVDSLSKIFFAAFSDLILHQPSVLLLDDLHVICENIKTEELMAPNAIYFNRVSEMLHNYLKLLSFSNKIGILATTESIEKLNKNMYTSRGSHLFKNIYDIIELTKSDRLKLMKFLLNTCDIEDIDFEELSIKTEGFVVQDIVDFCNKTVFEALKKESDFSETNEVKIAPNCCEKALKNTCVLSLQNLNLHSPGEKDFSDIGGLDDIKNALVESLMWPAKYPNIFSNAPLRLQSGLLLYGPPGTGKTILAAAAAKHCGLRLIAVKGPELLSKYIGASEQAVRDIFHKAQSIKPCILFFDEFDSLAPRRGHDNTGVTDRVVNQLLTQLDGVESLTGVCVLAATSRPDLLDPALLRPGRLDKQLLCPLPDKNERTKILEALSKNLDMDVDLDLNKISEASEWFSGADLQSLLYTAQMSTIEGLMESDDTPTEMSKSNITQKHLEEALLKTKPSLTKQDRLKYERIYTKFQSGSIGDFKAGSKATLA